MIDLHALTVEHVRTVNRRFESRLLDLYYHLRMHGAEPDDAVAAITLFVNETIARKRAAQN